MMRKIIKTLGNKTSRRAAKTLLIWLVIFSIFIFIFIKFVYYIKENIMYRAVNPRIKEETSQNIDNTRLIIQETDPQTVGNLSIT